VDKVFCFDQGGLFNINYNYNKQKGGGGDGTEMYRLKIRSCLAAR